MERLNLNTIRDIVYRLRRGQSERGIAKDLGRSRHTAPALSLSCSGEGIS